MSIKSTKVRKYLTVPVLLQTGKTVRAIVKTVTSQNSFVVSLGKGVTKTIARSTPSSKDGTPFIEPAP